MINRILIIVLLLASVLNAQSLDDFDWLMGEWVNFSEKDSSYEFWSKEEGFLKGYGLTIINGDTAFYEDLKLLEKDGTIYYEALVEDQNDGKPVLFRYIKNYPEYVFLNRQHDFPQKIVYTPRNDTLFITLEGIEEYYEKKIDFYFIRGGR